jgi:Domain of unknown function (DUF4386)
MSRLVMTVLTSPRRAALVAGVGLLLMAVLAGLANFAVLERLVIEGDAAGTAIAVSDALGIFRLAIVALFGVAVLDVVVALALWALFDRVHHAVAVTAAVCRALYALIFAVAISHLVSAAQLLSGRYINGTAAAEVLAEIQQFDNIWSIGLCLFGIHLLLIGWLALISGFVPRFIGVLVVIAGAGYIVDSLAPLLSPRYTFEVASVTFVGEVVLMIWLLVCAARRSLPSDDHRLRGAGDLTTMRSSGPESRS